jgi:flagellar hook assembly protein FlgD
LADNYPNPFGSGATFPAAGTAIEFELPRAGAVKLEIYDLLGQKIRTLVDQDQTAGVHRVVWDGKNGTKAFFV